jgi:UDP-glucuronate decarboxylase
VYRPLPSDDPVRRRPDISKAQQMLGWSPRVPLREGLRSTIEHCRRQMQGMDRSASSERAAVAASPR